MNDKDFSRLIELVFNGVGFLPNNAAANDLTDQCTEGSVISFTEVTSRDIAFHRCYMSLISFIWGYMPEIFKKSVPKANFYQFLKHLKRNYKKIYSFKDAEKKQEIIDKLLQIKKTDKSFKRVTKKNINIIAELFGRMDLVEYDSISFGKMSQIQFREYVKEQLPWIYESVIGAFFKGQIKDDIIETIETDYAKFFTKL